MKRFILLLICILLTGCVVKQPADKKLFSDGFSDPQSGWKVWTDDHSFVSYFNDQLRIFVNEPYQDVWTCPGQNISDGYLFVTAQLTGGANDNHYGVICRYKDMGNYYAFLMSSDGYAGIVKVKDGIAQLISAPTMEFQPIIHQGYDKNEIAAGCVGDELGLVINGETIYQLKDADFEAGDIGLLVGTHADAGVDVNFDDLVVLSP